MEDQKDFAINEAKKCLKKSKEFLNEMMDALDNKDEIVVMRAMTVSLCVSKYIMGNLLKDIENLINEYNEFKGKIQ